MRRSWILVVAALSMGCEPFRRLVAPPQDYEMYRPVRTHAAEGARLAAAYDYLQRYPRGAFAAEVAAFAGATEPRYFEERRGSPAGVLEYLSFLPKGPHHETALKLLVEYQGTDERNERERMLRHAAEKQESVEKASKSRKNAVDRVAAIVRSMLDPSVYGTHVRDLSPRARDRLGTEPNREEELAFTILTPSGGLARTLKLELSLLLHEGTIQAVTLQGPELLLRLAEARTNLPLRRADAAEVKRGREVALELLSALLELQLPGELCNKPPEEAQLLRRRCSGWTATVTMGETGGEGDAIAVRGPPHAPREK